MSRALSTDITLPAGCTETGERMEWNAAAGKYTHAGPCSRGREHRALELTVYPPAPPRPVGTGRDVGAWVTARDWERLRMRGKRLTEPELAAEYYRACVVTGLHGPHNEGARADILHRFATLPHAAEHGYE